jgi:signal transduction histidine kinase
MPSSSAKGPVVGSGPDPEMLLVLVVVDDEDMNRLVAGCLSAHYRVISAVGGREGLDRAQNHRPALVVADIRRPDTSGAAMIAEMRGLPELQATPVLLLAAKADDELVFDLLDRGAQDFVVAPPSRRELLIRVRNLLLLQQARAEGALQRRMLHSLFMQAPTLIAVLRGPRHVIELANPPMCRVWGRAEQEVLDRPLLEVMPELRDQVFPTLLDRVYRTGDAHVGKQTPATFDRGDGTTETLLFDFVYAPFRGLGGEIDGVFVVASDVTAQVHAREQVDGLREAAESANRAKDEFLAMLGHELRNPLSPILTALQLMKMQGPEGSERARNVIERQVNHLTRLVDDLLDVSRIARGKVELKNEIVEASELVAKAIEMTSPLLEQRNHTVTVDVPRRGLLLDGDPTRLGQVLSNLLTNAAKYTPPGGHVAVSAREEGNELVLSVRDTGIGIAPEVLPQIFDLFVQERQAIDRSQGGLGIGLTIVRNLIHGHGGSVVARSDGPGRGSEFVVRLPRAAAKSAGAPARAAPASALEGMEPRPGARRILVVDDNEDGAALLAEALAWKGYDTRVAHDAPEALRVAVEFSPDVAFLDIGLPVMDGYELASHLRDLPGLAELRLIALTGYGQLSDRQKTRAAGFHHHLVKPVNLEAALSSIRDLPPAR